MREPAGWIVLLGLVAATSVAAQEAGVTVTRTSRGSTRLAFDDLRESKAIARG